MSFGNLAYGGIQRSYSFGHFLAGRLAGSLNVQHGPDEPCEMVWIKADPDNTGDVFIGGNDVNSIIGVELTANDVLGWIPIKNLNLLYYVCTVASDKLQYMIVR